MIATKHFAGIFAALLVTAGGSQAIYAEPLRIGYLTWACIVTAAGNAGSRFGY
jgi:hypothetical protein